MQARRESIRLRRVGPVRDRVELTPEEQGTFPGSGAEKFPKILRFSTITVEKAGWTPGPGGGLDFLAYADPIGATGRRIKGQAKRQQSKQDVDDVGAFLSKLKGDDVGVFIALGGFTKNAEVIARSDERRLVLIDGAAFIRLWIEHYARLDEQARNLLRLRPIWRLVRPVD